MPTDYRDHYEIPADSQILDFVEEKFEKHNPCLYLIAVNGLGQQILLTTSHVKAVEHFEEDKQVFQDIQRTLGDESQVTTQTTQTVMVRTGSNICHFARKYPDPDNVGGQPCARGHGIKAVLSSAEGGEGTSGT